MKGAAFWRTSLRSRSRSRPRRSPSCSGFDLDVGDRPHIEPTAETGGTLYAFAPQEQIREIEAAGYRIEVGENVSETGRQRMAEVSEGDRFEGGRIPPRGLGRKPRQHDEGQGREPEQGGQAR